MSDGTKRDSAGQTRSGGRIVGNAAALLALLIPASCCSSTLWHPNEASRQEDVASTHVAVISVAPWSQFRDAVQPVFKLSADDALNKVVPTTAVFDERAF